MLRYLIVFSIALVCTHPSLAESQVNFTRTDIPGGYENMAIATADFNNDKIPDLIVADYAQRTLLRLFGNGDGTFRRAPALALNDTDRVASMVVADLNNDDYPDLVTASSQWIDTWFNDHGQNLIQMASQRGTALRSLVAADFDMDGNTDIAFALPRGSILLWMGTGDFLFRGSSSVRYDSGFPALAVGDFNGDAIPDLAVAGVGSHDVAILLGRGDGTFEGSLYSFPTYSTRVAVGDFNGDKIQDLVVGLADGRASILLGQGDGSFSASTSINLLYRPDRVIIGDFNGDMLQDIASLSTDANAVSVVLGRGDGSFNPGISFQVDADPIAIVVADFNLDGLDDLATANRANGTISVLISTQGP